jgi:hypothetical protein
MLAENLLAENNEKHGRAYRRACIALGKGSGQHQKAHEKLAT